MATVVDQPFTMPSKAYDYDSKKHKANSKALEDIVLSMTSQLVPTGVVVSYSGSVAPSGWLLTDGSAKSRLDYAALFNIIGTSSGTGDGISTFNIPTTANSIIKT